MIVPDTGILIPESWVTSSSHNFDISDIEILIFIVLILLSLLAIPSQLIRLTVAAISLAYWGDRLNVFVLICITFVEN